MQTSPRPAKLPERMRKSPGMLRDRPVRGGSKVFLSKSYEPAKCSLRQKIAAAGDELLVKIVAAYPGGEQEPMQATRGTPPHFGKRPKLPPAAD